MNPDLINSVSLVFSTIVLSVSLFILLLFYFKKKTLRKKLHLNNDLVLPTTIYTASISLITFASSWELDNKSGLSVGVYINCLGFGLFLMFLLFVWLEELSHKIKET